MEHERARVYGAAGLLLVSASAVALVANALHPRFDTTAYADPVAYVGEIEANTLWLVDHLVILAAALGIAVGLVGLAAHLAEESRPRVWAWATAVLAVIAGGVSAVVLMLDGVAASIFAGSAGASSTQAAAAVVAIDLAGFAALGLIVFGVLPMVLGLALVRSSVYPHWIGFVALMAGVIGIVMGVVTSVQGQITTTVTVLFLAASIPTTLVWLGTGLLLRRHASAETVGPMPDATPA